MTKVLYWIYLNLIRKWSSPLLYWIIRKTIYRGELPPHWIRIKNYDKEKFSEYINQYGYKWDYKKGILDFSIQEPDFFFQDREWFRDCDDWSRLWYLWALENGYKTWEVCVWKGFSKAHFITIFKEKEKYQVCNYRLSGKYNSLKKAIESVKGYNNWLIYKRGD